MLYGLTSLPASYVPVMVIVAFPTATALMDSVWEGTSNAPAATTPESELDPLPLRIGLAPGSVINPFSPTQIVLAAAACADAAPGKPIVATPPRMIIRQISVSARIGQLALAEDLRLGRRGPPTRRRRDYQGQGCRARFRNAMPHLARTSLRCAVAALAGLAERV